MKKIILLVTMALFLSGCSATVILDYKAPTNFSLTPDNLFASLGEDTYLNITKYIEEYDRTLDEKYWDKVINPLFFQNVYFELSIDQVIHPDKMETLDFENFSLILNSNLNLKTLEPIKDKRIGVMGNLSGLGKIEAMLNEEDVRAKFILNSLVILEDDILKKELTSNLPDVTTNSYSTPEMIKSNGIVILDESEYLDISNKIKPLSTDVKSMRDFFTSLEGQKVYLDYLVIQDFLTFSQNKSYELHVSEKIKLVVDTDTLVNMCSPFVAYKKDNISLLGTIKNKKLHLEYVFMKEEYIPINIPENNIEEKEMKKTTERIILEEDMIDLNNKTYVSLNNYLDKIQHTNIRLSEISVQLDSAEFKDESEIEKVKKERDTLTKSLDSLILSLKDFKDKDVFLNINSEKPIILDKGYGHLLHLPNSPFSLIFNSLRKDLYISENSNLLLSGRLIEKEENIYSIYVDYISVQ